MYFFRNTFPLVGNHLLKDTTYICENIKTLITGRNILYLSGELQVYNNRKLSQTNITKQLEYLSLSDADARLMRWCMIISGLSTTIIISFPLSAPKYSQQTHLSLSLNCDPITVERNSSIKLGQANSLVFPTETVYVTHIIPSSFDNNLILSVLG